eukprot:GHVL01035284.1.p1 GENE.GHVL01035284.1~~GHVL01035284.1.p1  ORF type:complete len:1502 (+),score=336.16 GHVL01035284.1:227-4732(+)
MLQERPNGTMNPEGLTPNWSTICKNPERSSSDDEVSSDEADDANDEEYEDNGISKNVVESESDDWKGTSEEDDDWDDSGDIAGKKLKRVGRISKPKPVKKPKKFMNGGTPRRSGRQTNWNAKQLSYVDIGGYESDEEDKMVDEARVRQQQEKEEGQAVDRVVTSRVNSETQHPEYLVKWRKKAHLANTWHEFEDLKQYHGIKKVENFIKRQEETRKRREMMTPDEIEQDRIKEDLQRQLDDEATIAERIIAQEPFGQSSKYLVKWTSQPYNECTWETLKQLLAWGFNSLVEEYHKREEWARDASHRPGNSKKKLESTDFKPYNRQENIEPTFLTNVGVELRDYQLYGVSWIVWNFKNGRSCMLADEMGLGKTIQTITVLGHLLIVEKICGPFLVIVPHTTVDSWMNEFKKWMSTANVTCYTGNAAAREVIQQYELKTVTTKARFQRMKVDIIVTTFDSVLADSILMSKVKWYLVVVDEAHQLKNRQSKRFQTLSSIDTWYKLLLTGTPLSNNIEEMWSLLNFMEPIVNNDFNSFKVKYPDVEKHPVDMGITEPNEVQAFMDKKREQVMALQKELQTFVLRRVKKDVEKSLPSKTERILRVELSPEQIKWYKAVITRNYEELRKAGSSKASLQNICMELKKICNHAFLLGSAPMMDDEYKRALVVQSGKICLLDKLLARLREEGHRVLIFSQMVKMLDILSEYLTLRGYRHQRLDGTMRREVRQKAMEHFNAPGSDDFAFLLSTKAGGLGITLTSADTVIIYDSDWNPQNDLQAEARAHRIGQTKQVAIYRLVTKESIEENILERAKHKIVLDTLIVQGLNKGAQQMQTGELFSGGTDKLQFSKDELSKILRFGADKLWCGASQEETTPEVDLDKILAEAEETVEHAEDKGAVDDLFGAFKNISDFAYQAPSPMNDAPVAVSTDDKDFWDKTIPEEERLRIMEEKRNELVIDGPRRSYFRDSAVYAMAAADAAASSSDDDGDEYRSKGKRKSITAKKSGSKDSKTRVSLSEREKWKLHKAVMMWGQERLDRIIDEANLRKIDPAIIIPCIYELKKRSEEALQKRDEQSEKKDKKKKTKSSAATGSEEGDEKRLQAPVRSIHFELGDQKVNAADFLERIKLLDVLSTFIERAANGETDSSASTHHHSTRTASRLERKDKEDDEEKIEEKVEEKIEEKTEENVDKVDKTVEENTGVKEEKTEEGNEEKIQEKTGDVSVNTDEDIKMEDDSSSVTEDKFVSIFIPERVKEECNRKRGWNAQLSDWDWTKDEALLRGIVHYGFGAWTEILDDPILGLTASKDAVLHNSGSKKFDKLKRRCISVLKWLVEHLDWEKEAAKNEVDRQAKREKALEKKRNAARLAAEKKKMLREKEKDYVDDDEAPLDRNRKNSKNSRNPSGRQLTLSMSLDQSTHNNGPGKKLLRRAKKWYLNKAAMLVDELTDVLKTLKRAKDQYSQDESEVEIVHLVTEQLETLGRAVERRQTQLDLANSRELSEFQENFFKTAGE